MPDTSNSSDEDDIELSHLSSSITLSEEYLEIPDEAPSRAQVVRDIADYLQRRLVMPSGSAFVAANALYGMVVTIMRAYPKSLPAAARGMARYEMPAVAAPMVLMGSLKEAGLDSLRVPHRVAMSAMSGLSVTNFVIPMTMEFITLVIQAIKGEPRSADVQISNWAAWPVVLACMAMGLLQSVQNDFLITNKENPGREKSRLNRFSTHQVTQTVSAILDAASNIHNLTMSAMVAAGCDTEADMPFYTRTALTFAAGAAGGIIMGRPERETRLDALYFGRLLNVTGLTSLLMSFTGTFYVSPNAVSVLGQSVIDEQTALWSAVLALPTLVIMLQLLGLKGPALWQSITDTLSRLIEYFQTPRQVDEIPEAIYNVDDLSYDSASDSSPEDDLDVAADETSPLKTDKYGTAALIIQHSPFLSSPVAVKRSINSEPLPLNQRNLP
ncbi:hypothetical protein [Legionella sp. CNM-4043-24]|uniref:hypothetical protein n=1 Tax=Legionella sp. CNM-4043-24 TaxID=3421646 RepID=UPI00403AC445